MVTGVSDLSKLAQYRLTNEYQDVIDALKQSFPGMSEAELEEAVYDYLNANQGKDLSNVGVQDFIDEICKALIVGISAEAAAAIKDELEDLARSMDIGVRDLVNVLDSYASGEIRPSREYLIMLWEMLQGEIEVIVAEESSAQAEANKNLQEGSFAEYIKKKLDSIAKGQSDADWGKALKWIGVAVSFLGAAVTCAAAVATGVLAGWTGLGAIAAGCMFASAAISFGMAVAGAVSAGLDEGGIEWSLGSGLGRLIGTVLKKMGADVDVDAFARWTAFAVQMLLVYTSISLSVAGGAFGLMGAAGSIGTSAAKAALDTATAVQKFEAVVKTGAGIASSVLGMFNALAGLVQAGVQIRKGVSTISLAISRADLEAFKALLEEMSKAREMDQQLTQRIFEIIFRNIRGQISDAINHALNDMESIVGMNMNKA